MRILEWRQIATALKLPRLFNNLRIYRSGIFLTAHDDAELTRTNFRGEIRLGNFV